MRNYIQPGDIVTLTAPAALASGDGFLVGSIFAVAVRDAELGASIDGRVTGVIELPKAAVTVAEGEAIYWDDTAKNVTNVSAGNTLVGAAVQAAATGVTPIRVRLAG